MPVGTFTKVYSDDQVLNRIQDQLVALLNPALKQLDTLQGAQPVTSNQVIAAYGVAANLQRAVVQAQSDADAANATLATYAADGSLAPAEKQNVWKYYKALLDGQAYLDSQADTYGVSRAAYDTALSDLQAYMVGLGLTLGTTDATWLASTTAIDGPTFRSKFGTAYLQRTQLNVNLQTQAQAQVNTIGNAATTALIQVGLMQKAFFQDTPPVNAAAPNNLIVNDKWVDTSCFVDTDGLTKARFDTYLWSGREWVLTPNAGNIVARTVLAGSITSSAITTAGLDAGVIKFGTLDGSLATITNINATNITTGTLSAARIAAGSLNASVIGAGTIDASLISVININATNITTGTLSAARIAAGSLNASVIGAGTIDASVINVTNLNAGNITTGTLAAARIAAASLNASVLGAGTIDASIISVTNLNAANISSGYLNAARIQAASLNASVLGAGTIDASVITVTNLNASNITAGTLAAAHIAAGSLNASVLGAGTIDASVITVTHLNATNITSGTLDVANRIASAAIYGGKIAAGTITASNIQAGSLTVDRLNIGGYQGDASWIAKTQNESFYFWDQLGSVYTSTPTLSLVGSVLDAYTIRMYPSTPPLPQGKTTASFKITLIAQPYGGFLAGQIRPLVTGGDSATYFDVTWWDTTTGGQAAPCNSQCAAVGFIQWYFT